MSDSKFINTYIDIIVGTLHDQINSILQLKTQIKIANDLVAEKDGVISSLTAELNDFRNNANSVEESNNAIKSELEKTLADAKLWQDSYHASQNKLSHMDTLTKQVSEMKNEIIKRDTEIEKLKQELENIKNPPKPIVENTSSVKVSLNNKAKAQTTTKIASVETKTKELPIDDF